MSSLLHTSDRRKLWISSIIREMITTSLSSPSSSSSLAHDNNSTSTTNNIISNDSRLNSNSSAISNNFLYDNNHNKITAMVQNSSSSAAALSSNSIISQMLLPSSSSTPSSLIPFYEIGEDMMMNNTLLSGNESTAVYLPIRDPLYIVIPITVIYLLIFITGLLGNIVTCVVIVRSRYLHTATNYYLFSLAISDLLLLLSGLPAEMHAIWRRYPDIFGEIFCIGKGLASETSANATVLTITAFTIERYLAICKPFLIQKWQNKLSRVVRQILVIWLISIALAVPQALQLGLVPMQVNANEEAMICTVKQIIIEHSFEIATFVFFVAPMVLITVLYCLIGYTLYHSNHVNESKLRLRKSLSSNKREAGQQRVLKMLVAVVVAFFLCWAPFHAQRLIAIWGDTWLESSTTLKTTYHTLIYISGVLYYVSTCINPILYHIMSLKFRHAFQVMVEGACSDSFGLGADSNRRSQDQNLLRTVFRDKHNQSISRSSRSTNGLLPLTEITMLSVSSSQQNGKVYKPSLSPLYNQYSYPQRINFTQPCATTV